jgi:hypothetical protein
MSLTVIVMLSAAALLLIQPQTNGAMAAVMQGKGGTIKPVPTPIPLPKKAAPQRSAQPSRANTKTNQGAKSKGDEAAATERTYWESIRSSTDPEDFKAYLKKYPNGQFADLANNRIRALEAAKAQLSPTPSPTPAPTPEPVYEWTKAERDLSAPVRVEFHRRSLSFSVPSGWTRTQREGEGGSYRQVSFRAPDSPQTNISVQCYQNGIPHTLRNGAAELWYEEKKLIDYRRSEYASQNVSTKLTDTEVVNHPTGRWYTFTADVLDMKALESGGTPYGMGLAASLDAVYPDDVWQEERHDPGSRFDYELKPGSLSAFTRTRHSYAIRQVGTYDDLIVMVYTAPIDQFDEKMLPSVMATLKMSGTIKVRPWSSDSSVSLSKYELEIVIDGERKGEAVADKPYLVSAGKHHITVRAKELKPFEKDAFVGAWEDLDVDVKLERTASSTDGAKPK